MKAIILAAGYATRLYPLTKDYPKALLQVAGKAILDYIVEEVETIDEVDDIIIVSNDLFYRHFQDWATGKRPVCKKKILLVNDGTNGEDTKLGAIRDLQFVLDLYEIEEDIVVIAGDNLFTYKLMDAFLKFRQLDQDLILAKILTDESMLKRMAVGILDENGRIVDMEEKPKNPKSDIAFFATYFYRRDTLPLIRQYLDEGNPPDAPGYFPAWLYMRKPVYAYLFEGECYDIGTKESYYEVRELFGDDSSEEC
jgi:glucose-1-phosphate thymidylyltransferase